MKQYDAIVIGSGSGTNIVAAALKHDWKVALLDKGPVGGTCANLGCIPSKLLIYPADRILDIRESAKLGINAELRDIDFTGIMERMRHSVRETHDSIVDGVHHTKNLEFYDGEAHFVDSRTIEVNGENIKSNKIFIASGSRPLIPPIKGLDVVSYLTSESLLQLNKQPESMIIIGGGYIAVEYGHFFEAMGTKVTILEMADRLILAEEPEIAALLKEELSKRMVVETGKTVTGVKSIDGNIVVNTNDKAGNQQEFSARSLLVAAGRKSNADLLKLENAGIAVNERGFIKVNEFMETTVKNIWAVGDINGIQMFTHAANREASIAGHNTVHGAKIKIDLSATPHAVFSHPQIASVGLTEEQARKDHKILVGKAKYLDTAKGEAMMEEKGFAKVIVEKETNKILGFHIIGPEAPTLIQEVINAMSSGGDYGPINAGMHIHPAMPELIARAFDSIEDAEASQPG